MCLYESRIISDRVTGFLPQVTCEGQVIGAIVAETQTEAQRAAKAVKVQYEELEPIITIEVRDWSLITGRGGYQTGGGAREVLPLRKGGAEKVLAMLKGGHKKFWGSFYAVA